MSDAEQTQPAGEWVDAAAVEDVQAKGKLGVVVEGHPLLLVWLVEQDRPVAFHDICIHKQRNLSEGVILNGRIVCPGHQWSYDLVTGHCAARDRYQPTYRAEVVDGRIHVDVSAPVDVAGVV